MKKRNIVIVLICFVFSLIGFLLLQKQFTFNSTQQVEKQSSIDLESDHSLENTTDGEPNFIENLLKRKFLGGEIKIESTISQNDEYTSYLISYPSDTLKIYGIMNIPQGEGPFPVIVLNHGYYNPSKFNSGDGTKNIADILVPKGYITLASDYRGHGNSDNDSGSRGGHRPEYAIDVINLVASINSIPQADINRIGMWGHSMGGEVSLRTAIVSNQIKAIALWAPTSADAADNLGYYGGNHQGSISINPSLRNVSPINFLTYINAPVSIHQGSEDTEVNPEWSRELNEALKVEGKTVEYFEYEGQDHNFRNLGWDEIVESTLSFYDKYL